MESMIRLFAVFAIVLSFSHIGTPCPCSNGGTCLYDKFGVGYCVCTVGFYGGHCTDNALIPLKNSVVNDNFTLPQAEKYMKDAHEIIQEHLSANYQLSKSIYYLACIGTLVVEEMDEKFRSIRYEDLLPLTKEMAASISFVISILDIEGCQLQLPVADCKNTTENCTYLIERTEANLVKVTNLYLGSAYGEGDFITIDERPDDPILSLTVIKTSGRKAPFLYQARYGSLELPYWGTLQNHIGYSLIAINVLTYKSNPYKYSANAANITSSVVRIVITDRRGNDVRLYDLQDQLTTTMDLSQVLSGNTEWIDMNHNGEEWKLVAHTNLSVEAMVVDIKLKSRYDCTLYGLFGWTGYPSRRSYNIKVVTRGDNKIVRKSPWSLPLFYKDSELQITIYNTEFIDGGYIPPLLMTVKCQDDDFSRTSQIHQYRVLDLESYYLENDDWSKSNKARVYSVQGTNVVIKNSFFGTFAANSLFIPPSPIDFDKIFENFLERLTSTPHVLVAIIIVLLVTIPVNVFLRRADKEDHYRWLYLPLIDNSEGETCMYFLSIYTAVRSSRFLTSHCYFNLKGESSTTGDRILSDGCRQNFTRGTCCNFLLTTKQELGQLQKITVWHDNKGNNPNWLLSKIVIEDALTREKYIFICEEWLSFAHDSKTWMELSPLTQDHVNGSLVFNESSRRGFFDDHLWFSLTMRPNASKFTRVQRLWCLVALLFLSMVTSAMWFKSNPSSSIDEANQMKLVSLGPFTFSYRMLYVGFCSSLITFLPSFAFVFIFNKRKFRVGKPTEQYVYQKPSHDHQKCQLPWWTIFVAYCLIGLSILAGGAFTFFYSLEFGTETTNDWLMAFVFGTLQNIFLLEPCKVFILAVGLSCICSSSLHQLGNTESISYPTNGENVTIYEEKKEIKLFPCPQNQESKEIEDRKNRQKLDFQLTQHLRAWLLVASHVTLVAVICNHNDITDSFWQNEHIKRAINSTFNGNTTDDIFTWFDTYFIPSIWPTHALNGNTKLAYEQRFLMDEYHYRVSLTQIRQVRKMGEHNQLILNFYSNPTIKGSVDFSGQKNCTEAIPGIMNPVETVCYSEFYFLDSTNENFCKDWTPDNGSCFDDNEAIDISFRFRTSDELKTLPYVGVFSVYGGGGYKIDIGPKQSLAMDYLSQLKSLNWIDLYTRAVFVDTFLFNANTRLFTNIKVVFEISEFGSMEMKTNTYSFNMFPYITPWDYCVLIFQLLFIIIVAARFVFLVVNIVKLRLKSFSYFATYLRMAEIVLSVSAVILYILRIDQTLQGVTDVGNYLESHVSFEFAMMYDQLYQEALAVVMFIVSLDLLKPLTFNSHLHILYSSLSNGRKELLSYMLLFMIAISAFASYLHITTGYLVYDFRNPFTAILTLMQILLSMISLKKHPEISSLQAQIVISIFAFVMTLVFLNFFISVLNFYFSEGKENLEKSSQFLKHLNNHFWWRCNRFSKEFWRTISCQKLQTQDDQIEELLRLLKSKSREKMLQDMDVCKNMIVKLLRELQEFHSTAPNTCASIYESNTQSLMDCLIIHMPNRIECRFYSILDDGMKFTIAVPPVAYSLVPDLICYENNVDLFVDRLPTANTKLSSGIYEIKQSKPYGLEVLYCLELPIRGCKEHQSILCSFDNGQNWSILTLEKKTSSFQRIFEDLPSHFAMTE